MGRRLERFCGERTFRRAVTLRFGDALVACVGEIPRGQAATCGTVARALGDVRAARAVAEWIRAHPELDPGRQVVRADGRPVLGSSGTNPEREHGPRSVSRFPPERLIDHLAGVPILGELRAEQEKLAALVREEDGGGEVRTLGGADVAYAGDRAFAAAVSLDASSLEVLETTERQIDVDFPYIPSYLAFREFPAIQRVVAALRRKPDMLFIDGHGRLHPVGFGFACFAGVSLDLPTIGIAKHPLSGTPNPSRRTDTGAIPIELRGDVEGYAWIPPHASRAFYVSVGHRIRLGTALATAQRATRDRYPEPLSVADRISKEEKKKNEERSASGRSAARRPPAQGRQGI